MAAATILEFCNFKLLTVKSVEEVKLRQIIKYRDDRSDRCWDVVIFRFFKIAAAAILN